MSTLTKLQDTLIKMEETDKIIAYISQAQRLGGGGSGGGDASALGDANPPRVPPNGYQFIVLFHK